jgi:hypothetical protein
MSDAFAARPRSGPRNTGTIITWVVNRCGAWAASGKASNNNNTPLSGLTVRKTIANTQLQIGKRGQGSTSDLER